MTQTECSAVLPARHIHEECGVFGVYTPETSDVASLAYYALYALQQIYCDRQRVVRGEPRSISEKRKITWLRASLGHKLPGAVFQQI